MLVCVWNAMDAAIPQIAAQEWLDSYTVAVISSPYADKESRDNILEGWRNLIIGSWRKTFRSDGTKSQQQVFMPLRDVIAMVKAAFGRQIRE